MWREFGLAGDWRNQTSQVAWLASLALAQRIQALEVGAEQRLGQCPVGAAVRPRHRLDAKALDPLERWRDDVVTAQHVKHIADQQNALVGLQCQLGQCVDGLAEVAQAERRQAETSAKLNQTLALSFLTFRVLCPANRFDGQLVCNPPQHWRFYGAVHAQTLVAIPQQAHPYREAQAVRISAALTNQRQIVVDEGVVPNQFVLGGWQGRQAIALGGAKHGSTRHEAPSFNRRFLRSLVAPTHRHTEPRHC